MDDFIGKPFTPDSLWAMLRKWLRGQGAFDSPGQAPADDEDAGEVALRSALMEIEGLDSSYGIGNMRGSVRGYARLLRQLAESQEAEMARLRELLAAGILADAQRLVHSQKGILGLLGVILLEPLAEDLEEALRERRPAEEIDALVAALETEQLPMMATLLRVLPESASPGGWLQRDSAAV
jgi:HPt (histidine-containing phosphotransfer) domain-containing protein